MKEMEQYHKCEHCNKRIPAHLSDEGYNQGVIFIDRHSSLLLPHAVVEARHIEGISDSHAASLDGYYCDVTCLTKRITRLLNPEVKKP